MKTIINLSWKYDNETEFYYIKAKLDEHSITIGYVETAEEADIICNGIHIFSDMLYLLTEKSLKKN